MKIKQLVSNRIKTPDGTILISRHQHDYVEYTDKISNVYYAIDGGLTYSRIITNGKFENLSVYSDDKFELIRYVFEWGSYGKDGKDTLHYVTLQCMNNIHIEKIIETQHHILPYIKNIFKKELIYRKKNNIIIVTE